MSNKFSLSEPRLPSVEEFKRLAFLFLIIAVLWSYLNLFLSQAIEMTTQVSRSVILPDSGLESNKSYYSLKSILRYVGGAILVAFILIQNELKHVIKPILYFDAITNSFKKNGAVLDIWKNVYKQTFANWEKYITTLFAIVIFLVLTLWSEGSDLSARSQVPIFLIGGSILTAFLLLKDELQTLFVMILKSIASPNHAREIWETSWKTVTTTVISVVIFLFFVLNAVYFPVIVNNLSMLLSFFVVGAILFSWNLMNKELSNPAIAARQVTAFGFLLALPLILYLILRLMILVRTDPSWDLTLDFMQDTAGFNITNWPDQVDIVNATRWEFYRAGMINAIRAVLVSIFFCTFVGLIVGVTRLSNNSVAASIATVYVEIFRNFPLAVLLFLTSSVLGQTLPQFREEVDFLDMAYLSNQGIWLPIPLVYSKFGLSNLYWCIVCIVFFWLFTKYEDWNGFDDSEKGIRRRIVLWTMVIAITLGLALGGGIDYPHYLKPSSSPGSWYVEGGFEITPAFIAMVTALTLYTSAHVAEIVRGSIQSLPRGQIEAAISLGLTPFQRLRLVILPQALRSMIPSLNNQYLNVWKNSSLALIVAYNDFFYVNLVIVNKVGKAVPSFLLLLVTYQAGSLLISGFMNFYNSQVTKVKI